MDIIKPKIHEKLSHLNFEQINEVIDLYMNSDIKISEILATYEIDARPSEIRSILPLIIHEDVLCDYCNHPMWSEIPSRTNNYTNSTKQCPICKHNDTSYCSCTNCNNIKKMQIEQERKRKRELLNKSLDLSKYRPVPIDDLSYEHRIYLGALLRAGLSENMEYIIPLNDFKEPLSPRDDYTNEIINDLFEAEIIKIHPQSPESAFVEINEDLSSRFYTHQVYWHFNVSSENSDRDSLISRLMNPLDDDYIFSIDNFEAWKRVALEECLEYLEFRLKKVDLTIKIGRKTIETFNDLLNHYSVSQIYYIIYRAIGRALQFREEKRNERVRITDDHTANLVVFHCRDYGERASANQWDIANWSHDENCPQSILSKFLYNRVLKVGDDGFKSIPRPIGKYKDIIDYYEQTEKKDTDPNTDN